MATQVIEGEEMRFDIRAITLCEPFPTGNTTCRFIDISTNEVIYIPNAFSPNGDGINDDFIISPIEGFSVNSIEIYTKYGERVHQLQLGGITPQMLSWDGRFNGQVLQPQVLICLITLINPNGELERITSNLSLFR